MHSSDTIVALATPPGEGALAIIRLSGPDAVAWTDHIFIGAKLTSADSHTIHFGQIQGKDGEIIDEVLVFVFKNPTSYTGEDVMEISCHGSSYIIQKIIDRFIGQGARLANPGEFTQRAFLNGRMDLSQAEAVADLIASKSAAAHLIAIRQMRGGFSSEIKEIRSQLIDFASLIELELDFAEEDVEFANRKELIKLIDDLAMKMDGLIQSFRLGNVIKKGISTVIVGRPNAGKSTLLNKLISEERAIVSEIPGTTRDTVEELININGVQFRLVDTAGIREAQDKIEEIGVEKTFEKIKNATLILYVFDVAKTSQSDLQEDLATLPMNDCDLLVVANKMDLNPYAKAEEYLSPMVRFDQFIPVSAINNMNIDHLKNQLYQIAVARKLNLEGSVVSNMRHVASLEHTTQSLRKAKNGFNEGLSSDFIAMDIRQAIYHLGEITGEISTDDLLDNIFRNFCIGK